MPQLCPRCHIDEGMQGGTTTVHLCNTTREGNV
jgi:hypothetical protein